MGLGNEPGAEQLAQGSGIDGIGLDLGVGNRLQELRMGEAKINAVADEQVAEPIPAAGGFDDGSMGPGDLCDVTAQADGLVGQAGVADGAALLGVGRKDRRAAVLIDASVEHRWLPARDASSYARSRLEGSSA